MSPIRSAPARFRPSMLRTMLRTIRSFVHRSSVLQIAILAAFWALGEAAVGVTGLPLPGGIVGMAVVLALLASGHIRPAAVRRGAGWLLAEMLLFFVPAVMAILDHSEFMGLLGLKIAAVIVAGTVMVMGGTALAVDLCYRWRLRLAGEGAGHADA